MANADTSLLCKVHASVMAAQFGTLLSPMPPAYSPFHGIRIRGSLDFVGTSLMTADLVNALPLCIINWK